MDIIFWLKIFSGVFFVFVSIFFFLLKPNRTPLTEKQKKTLEKMRKTFAFAHRGLFDNNNGIPENSLQAFQRAVDHSFGIELDVHLTIDNKLVISHDDTITPRLYQSISNHFNDLIGKNIRDVSYEDIKRNIVYKSDVYNTMPTLEDVLRIVSGKVPIIIELKDQKDEKRNLKLAEFVDIALTTYSGTISIQSFNPMLVRAFYELPGASQKYLIGLLGCDIIPEILPSKIKRIICRDFLGMGYSRAHYIAGRCGEYEKTVVSHLVEAYHTPVIMWTITSLEQYKYYQSKKVDAVIFEGFIPESPKL